MKKRVQYLPNSTVSQEMLKLWGHVGTVEDETEDSYLVKFEGTPPGKYVIGYHWMDKEYFIMLG
jgi:hypothetical protein